MEINSLKDLDGYDSSQPMGSGGFAKVYKVTHKKSGRACALKVIDMERLSMGDCESLRSEIEIHEKLNHPNIVKFYDSIQVDDILYFLLELGEQGSLSKFMQGGKVLSEKLALRFLLQAARALRHLHERGVIHRDVKPENLLLSERFDVKLCDFGWSCPIDSDSKTLETTCGTFQYSAPEVCNHKSQTPKIDVWALGVIFFEMLVGRPPFVAFSLAGMKQEIERTLLTLPGSASSASQDLRRQVLTIDPEQRPSIQQVLQHPALAARSGELLTPLTSQEKSELERNFQQSDLGKRMKLLKEVEELIEKSNARKESEDLERLPSEKNPNTCLQNNKKVILIGDPLDHLIPVPTKQALQFSERENQNLRAQRKLIPVFDQPSFKRQQGSFAPLVGPWGPTVDSQKTFYLSSRTIRTAYQI